MQEIYERRQAALERYRQMEHDDDDDDVVFESGEDEIDAMPPIEPYYTSSFFLNLMKFFTPLSRQPACRFSASTLAPVMYEWWQRTGVPVLHHTLHPRRHPVRPGRHPGRMTNAEFTSDVARTLVVENWFSATLHWRMVAENWQERAEAHLQQSSISEKKFWGGPLDPHFLGRG